MKKISTSSAFGLVLLLILTLQVKAQLPQLTNLPTLYITTDESLPVTDKETWRTGNLTIAAPDGTEGAYNGAIEIRGRGNSTWEMAKKPYRIRLASKYQLLGMPAKEKNWVLLANYADKTLMRNALAFEVSKFLGLPYSCPYRFVDVYLNNVFMGNYTLTDHIQIADKRVEVEKQEVTDTQEPQITGGYLVEADGFAYLETSKFSTPRGLTFTIKYPEDDEINSDQANYISNHFQKVENSLFSSDFQEPELGYMKYMDKSSLVNWYLASEITANPDAFWSTYMFKKRSDDKVYFGPLWDFDIAFNNDNRLEDATYKRMSNTGHYAANRIWIERMLQDNNFKEALSQRWKELKSAGLENHLNQLITSLASTLSQSQQYNYQTWPVLNSRVYYEVKASGTYQEHVEFLRTFLSRHLAWLDQQITGEFSENVYFKIANKSSGKVISSSENQETAIQKNFTATDYMQQWRITTVESNGVKYFKLKNRQTGRFLQSADDNMNSTIILRPDAPDDKQHWQLSPLYEESLYGIINKTNSLAVSANSSNENDPVVQANNFVNVDQNEQWIIEAMEPDALPVYISGLKAVAKQNFIELSWQVYDNKGGDYFEIERLENENTSSHATIGTVPLTDVGIGKYSFTDIHPLPGNNYYRLKKVDLDETFTYTKYVSAKNSEISSVSIWPLPSTNMTNLSFSSVQKGTGILEIYNNAGNKLGELPLQVESGVNNYQVNTDNLNQGLYILKVKYGNETVTVKLLKVSN